MCTIHLNKERVIVIHARIIIGNSIQYTKFNIRDFYLRINGGRFCYNLH